MGTEIFYKCTELKSVSFSGNKITQIPEKTFTYCSALSDVEFPTLLDTIDTSAFYETGIKKLVLPSSLTKIGDKAFYGCKSLTSVSFSDKDVKLEEIGASAFYGCNYLSNFVLIYIFLYKLIFI